MSSWGRSPLVRRGLFVSVVVLVCVAVGVPAFAYTNRSTHTYVIRSGKKPMFGSSSATCPSGQHVLFGGFSNGVAGMRRTASNRLTVDGYNLGGAPLWLTAFAYCGHGPVATQATGTVKMAAAGTARRRPHAPPAGSWWRADSSRRRIPSSRSRGSNGSRPTGCRSRPTSGTGSRRAHRSRRSRTAERAPLRNSCHRP